MSDRKAVVLVSGGLDSATTLAMARQQGFTCYAMTFDYDQRHRCELEAASRVAALLGACEHRVITLDLRQFGGSALTDDAIGVPEQPGNVNGANAGRIRRSRGVVRPRRNAGAR